MGSLTLTPTFDADTTAYTTTTSNASNALTATPADAGATVEVKLGDDVVTAGSNGKYTLTWDEGENVVTVKVTDGSLSKTYTITVTSGD